MKVDNSLSNFRRSRISIEFLAPQNRLGQSISYYRLFGPVRNDRPYVNYSFQQIIHDSRSLIVFQLLQIV